MKSAASSVASVEDKVKDVRGVKVLAHRVDNLDRGQMRTLVDNMRNKLGSGVVVLGSAQSEDGKVALIVGVTRRSGWQGSGRKSHQAGRGKSWRLRRRTP